MPTHSWVCNYWPAASGWATRETQKSCRCIWFGLFGVPALSWWRSLGWNRHRPATPDPQDHDVWWESLELGADSEVIPCPRGCCEALGRRVSFVGTLQYFGSLTYRDSQESLAPHPLSNSGGCLFIKVLTVAASGRGLYEARERAYAGASQTPL